MIIPIFIPHGGCPERCNFCDQSVSGGHPISISKVDETVRRYLSFKKNTDSVEAAFYGGTFTALTQQIQERYLEVLKPFLESKEIHSVRIATRPDAIDKIWLKVIKKKFQVKTIEIGAQSFNLEVLQALGRSHSVKSIGDAVYVLKELNISCGLHLMVGCPKESAQDDFLMVKKVLELRPDFIRLHPLLILKDTPLEKLWQNGEFAPLSIEQAVERCAWITSTIEKEGIKVIRLGLQTNEFLPQAVLAGPYHPAFGDLVRGRILRKKVCNDLQSLNPHSGGVLEIALHQKEAGSFVGPHRENLNWLKKTFELHEIFWRST